MIDKKKRILTIRLKRKWWDQIKSGEKLEEYRIDNDYWTTRLVGKEFDEIHIWQGYPKATETDKRIVRKWNGYRLGMVQSEEFGPWAVSCFCIDVSQEVIA